MIGDILQPTHLLFVLVVALLVLGPKRLPEVGRALGRGLRDFRNALSTDELRDQMTSTTSAMTSTPSDPPAAPAPSESTDPSPHVAAPGVATPDDVATAPEPVAPVHAPDRPA